MPIWPRTPRCSRLGEASAFGANVADDDSIAELFAFAVATYGGVDVVHNNAIGVRRPEGCARRTSPTSRCSSRPTRVST